MSKAENKLPADKAERDRFIHELDHNFSVLAPAGVGKTKSLVDRVVAIAQSPQAAEWLPRLVVVTYTNKAADEMYQRARNEIIAKRVSLQTLNYFNQSFFGTLHSFCVRLLRSHGHLCGLPSRFEPVENDDELWEEFKAQTDRLAPGQPADRVSEILRLVPLDKLFKLARSLSGDIVQRDFSPIAPPPEINLRAVLQFEGVKKTSDTIRRSQRAAREWEEIWRAGSDFAELPECETVAKDFAPLWDHAFEPLRKWMGSAALRVAADLARAYRAFRRERSALTFDDQVELAWELLQHPVASRRLREEGFRIILDEAQDTDPLQFNILLELARPVTAKGSWMESGGEPPEPGRICMVGDPQQAIYGDRADLGHYEEVREKIARENAADELVFTVTFRCDKAIIGGVNALVEPMFSQTEGQVSYTPLTPRPAVGPGQIARWAPTKPPEDVKKVEPVSEHEANQLAAWIKTLGVAGLGAESWSDVAILCPRNGWLQTVSTALRNAELPAQVHSERSVQADDPAYSWFTALLHIMANPTDGYEIVGVLREIYGIADETLALYAQGDGKLWDLTRTIEPGQEVARVLAALGQLHAEIQTLPLREAARRAIEQTALRERLQIIQESRGDVIPRLDFLLTLAGRAESDGLSLSEFAEQLREGLEDTLPARPVQRDAVQLLSCHKAKGLQWGVVILPLMFRTIGSHTNSKYPAVLKTRPGEEPTVAFSDGDVGDASESVKLKERQELQRLLYVAMTRAKRTLIVADDYSLFPAKKQNRSFADLLGMMDTEGKLILNETWNAWSDDVEPLAAPAQTSEDQPEPAWPPLSTEALAAATQHASDVSRRILPYQLGEAQARSERALIEPEGERSASAEAARGYGIWWHETIEHLDWRAGRSAWEKTWKAAVPACPQPERGQREGEMLFNSELARRLNQPGLVLHREMPILWRKSGRECVEGIVDLAAWDPQKGAWLIVDWKTNIVGVDGQKHLRQIYEPQLRAYAGALREISGAPALAGVHSTFTGEWIVCAEIG